MLKFLDANLHPERGPLQRAMAFAQEERVPAGNMGIGLNWLTAHAGPDKIICTTVAPAVIAPSSDSSRRERRAWS